MTKLPAAQNPPAAHPLLAAHPEPHKAREEWAKPHGMMLLPLGTVFAAVRMPARLVHAAAGSDEHTTVNRHLARDLRGGPVICDPCGRRYYALVPADTDATWSSPNKATVLLSGAECLGLGTRLGVPRLDAVRPGSGVDSYWSVPMRAPAEVCDPADVVRLCSAGHFAMCVEDPV